MWCAHWILAHKKKGETNTNPNKRGSCNFYLNEIQLMLWINWLNFVWASHQPEFISVRITMLRSIVIVLVDITTLKFELVVIGQYGLIENKSIDEYYHQWTCKYLFCMSFCPTQTDVFACTSSKIHTNTDPIVILEVIVCFIYQHVWIIYWQAEWYVPFLICMHLYIFLSVGFNQIHAYTNFASSGCFTWLDALRLMSSLHACSKVTVARL